MDTQQFQRQLWQFAQLFITVPDKTENGRVSVSLKNASKGSTVTITVTPDSGYVLETISVPAYALEAMDWAVNAGVLKGDNNRLLPQDNCTRAQIVTMLYRALGEK